MAYHLSGTSSFNMMIYALYLGIGGYLKPWYNVSFLFMPRIHRVRQLASSGLLWIFCLDSYKYL